jgi:hypothetical protein
MTPFDPQSLTTVLWTTDRLPELGPGRPNQSARAALAALTPETVAGTVRDRDAALGCISGLWLLHDFLDESHQISQDLHTWYGSYLHGIMHRREPDPDNAKYWFRRVGPNDVFAALAASGFGPELGMPRGAWDPFAFVDRCERERGTASMGEEICRHAQVMEIKFLIVCCRRKA